MPRPGFFICDDCIDQILRPAPRRAADTDFAGAGAPTAETGVGGSFEACDGVSRAIALAPTPPLDATSPPRTSGGVASLSTWAPGEITEAYGS